MKAKSKLDEELQKLGLRIRPRTVGGESACEPGHIAFDDRGNAVYEWSENLADEGEGAEAARRRALEHPSLALVDEEPRANAPVASNSKGLRVGYNPYESGLLPKKPIRKKRDLRELSKWIETRKKLQQDEK